MGWIYRQLSVIGGISVSLPKFNQRERDVGNRPAAFNAVGPRQLAERTVEILPCLSEERCRSVQGNRGRSGPHVGKVINRGPRKGPKGRDTTYPLLFFFFYYIIKTSSTTLAVFLFSISCNFGSNQSRLTGLEEIYKISLDD